MHNNATYVADFKSKDDGDLDDASKDAGDAKHSWSSYQTGQTPNGI